MFHLVVCTPLVRLPLNRLRFQCETVLNYYTIGEQYFSHLPGITPPLYNYSIVIVIKLLSI